MGGTSYLSLCFQQVSNATTVYVRRPGNPKKWRARVACEGRICDLALLTVDEDAFWAEPLQGVQFVDVPELQVVRQLRVLQGPHCISCVALSHLCFELVSCCYQNIGLRSIP